MSVHQDPSDGPRERLTWIGGASDRNELHARDIALRRRAEQANRHSGAHPAPPVRTSNPGTPRSSHALITIANQEQPPRRFIAGADALATAEQKIADLKGQIEANRALSTSLAFD